MHSDKYFFQKFPIGSVITLLVGIFLFLVNLSFVEQIKYLREYNYLVHFAKNSIAFVLIVYSIPFILMYFIKFPNKKKFEMNLEEVKKNFLDNIKSKDGKLIADFVSFRPWMNQEFYVKSVKGIPKIFIPIYLVSFTIKNDILYIIEAEVSINSKEYRISGYYLVHLSNIVSANLSQDRIFFSSSMGDAAAKVNFIEIIHSSGTIKIPIFEEELLSNYGNISPLREEYSLKVMTLLKYLNKELL
ncbi:hypothetical protein [Fervidobacterium sp. 2310opik-2]|uniref:hypothetical protein n=1 Tax=Fervidobacterium sp. 2310opik-2 TaxID=1755815 RepID=UPI0013DFE94D|nr:hypothetical protein [Fervidobacterium sp. 2310opik-2]KAF2962202.1 hypothetical protein AS161_05850 [Fervidobacterium sp. 2310opik-2]